MALGSRGLVDARHGCVQCLLNMVHKLVCTSGIRRDSAQANEDSIQEGFEESEHVVFWLLAMQLQKRHVDELIVQGSNAAEDLCLDMRRPVQSTGRTSAQCLDQLRVHNLLDNVDPFDDLFQRNLILQLVVGKLSIC